MNSQSVFCKAQRFAGIAHNETADLDARRRIAAFLNATRHAIRWRSLTPKTVRDLLFNKYLLEPIHFTMEHKMMPGIRERAEAGRP